MGESIELMATTPRELAVYKPMERTSVMA